MKRLCLAMHCNANILTRMPVCQRKPSAFIPEQKRSKIIQRQASIVHVNCVVAVLVERSSYPPHS